MKKIMCILMISCLLICNLNFIASSASPVDWALEKGIITADSSNDFKINDLVTEASFLVMLLRMTGQSFTGGANHWADGAYSVAFKYNLPLEGGLAEKRDLPVSKGLIARLIASKNGFNLTEKQAAYYLYENKILEHDNNPNFEKFEAEKKLTRSEALELLEKVYNAVSSTTFLGQYSQKGNTKGSELKGIVNVPILRSLPVFFNDLTDENFLEEAKKYTGIADKSIFYYTDVKGRTELWEWNVQPGVSAGSLPTTPGTAVSLPYTEFGKQNDNLWFERNIDIPNEDKRFYLDFSGVQCDAVVFINGNKVKEFKGPNGIVEITDFVEGGKTAKVSVWVTRWWVDVANKRENDYFRDVTLTNMSKSYYGGNDDKMRPDVPVGINRHVVLVEKSKEAELNNIKVETSWRDKNLRLKIDAKKQKDFNGRIKIWVSELDYITENLPSAVVDLKDGYQIIDIPWENPVLWEVGAGYLYYVNFEIVDEGQKVYDEKKVRFGFREIWRDGKEIILNGHPLQLSPIMVSNLPDMMLYEGMGFNAILNQPNHTFWFSAKRNGIFKSQNTDMLDYADERGIVFYMSAPSNFYAKQPFLKEPEIQADYASYFDMWTKYYDMQNRPSVISWTASMNTGNQYEAQKIGKTNPSIIESTDPKNNVKMLTDSIMREIDPTRLVFAHAGEGSDAGGAAGDIATSNWYPNHMNLQEFESYMLDWYRTGDKPWGPCEFGIAFEVDYINAGGIIPLYTEYGARYYGDEAYDHEKEEYITELQNYLDKLDSENKHINNTNTWFGVQRLIDTGFIDDNIKKDWTIHGKFVTDMVNRVYPAWRAFGLNYGANPFFTTDTKFGLDEDYASAENVFSLREKPDSANNIYDALKGVFSDLDIFLGGPEENFTLKEHNFVSGETAEKTLVGLWAGVGSKKLNINWQFKEGKNILLQGTEKLELMQSVTKIVPLKLTMPNVSYETELKLAMNVYDEETNLLIKTEEFEFTVYPKRNTVNTLKSNWGIYDPSGVTTAELAKIGFTAREIKDDDSLDELDCLIMGTNNTGRLLKRPYSKADLERGLTVVYMEQNLDTLEAIGIRAQDVVPRIAFSRDTDHPILNNVKEYDLRDWRGSGNLIPEYTAGKRVWPMRRMSHNTNAGSIASVVIETPQVGAFTPILDTEFDLAYSPLVTLKEGKGEVILSQFDFNGRLDLEPAAAKIAVNIISYADSRKETFWEQSKSIAYYGADSSADMTFLKTLGLSIYPTSDISEAAKKNDLIVIGSDDLTKELFNKTKNIVNSGGSVFIMPQKKNTLQKAQLNMNFDISQKSITGIKSDKINSDNSLLSGIGPNLLHFRKFVNIDTFVDIYNGKRLLDGLLWQLDGDNNGIMVFSQLDWKQIWNSVETPNMIDNTRRVKWNTTKYFKQLFTNLGVKTDDTMLDRIFLNRQVLSDGLINEWIVAKTQYQVSTASGDGGMFPGVGEHTEMDDWIADRQKPSPSEWEKISLADDENTVNFATSLATVEHGTVSYAATNVYSTEDRKATLKLYVDYWTVVYLNGEKILDHSEMGRGGNPAVALEMSCDLKAGWNEFIFKVAAGSAGSSVGMSVSNPGDVRSNADSDFKSLPAPADLPPENELIKGELAATQLELYYGGLFYIESLVPDTDPYKFYAW